MHRGFFKEAHLNGGPLISGAAQERRMMFLEELVAVIAGEEASSLTGKAAEPGYPQPVEREGATAGQESSGRRLPPEARYQRGK